jgi:malonyl-CoA O-methyltransferase
LRGKRWRQQLHQALSERLGGRDGGTEKPLSLTFEIIYGHAFKPAPRVRVSPSSSVSLSDMRAMLRNGPVIE